jgi:DNA uptake protein ComE-like DNA-binding protein
MGTFTDYIQTQPYVVPLNNISIDSLKSNVSDKILQKLADSLKETMGMLKEKESDPPINLVLPIVCLSDKPQQYSLLTGLPMIEAAKLAGLEAIWVILIKRQKSEAIKALHSLSDLLKFNEMLADNQMQEDFVKILNDKAFDLTSIKGIGKITAEKIIKSRPYKDWQDVEKMGGKRTPLKWLQNYWSNH